MEGSSSGRMYPDIEQVEYTRDYATPSEPQEPLHDAYAQSQIDALAGGFADAPPAYSPSKAQQFSGVMGQQNGNPHFVMQSSPAAPLGIHPSMVPRNQQSHGAPPPNMYNVAPKSPRQQHHQLAQSGNQLFAAPPPPYHAPSPSPQPQPKAHSQVGEFDVGTGFMTPPPAQQQQQQPAVVKEEPAPPIPPRLSQLSELHITSPQAFSAGQSPAPKPGEMLIPNLGTSGAAPPVMTQPLPPVPPRSPRLASLKSKGIEEQNSSTKIASPVVGDSLLDFHAPPEENPQQSGLLKMGQLEQMPQHDDWEIDADDLVFEKEIASGTFGSVWRGQFQRTPCAIKKLHGTKLTSKQLQEFHSEVDIMKKFRHPNVVLFMGFSCDKITREPQYMVFEYLERGSLWSIIHDKRVYITQPMRVRMAQDIARGLFYLHSLKPPVLHRDIKSPNILADAGLALKVADFGLSKTRQFLQEQMTSQTGTYQYMAPEVIQGTDYSLKADVFSYGIVLWEILARLPPYQGIPGMTLAFKVVNEGLRPTIPANCDPMYAQLIQACWATNPELRPSFGFVLDSLQMMQQQGQVARK